MHPAFSTGTGDCASSRVDRDARAVHQDGRHPAYGGSKWQNRPSTICRRSLYVGARRGGRRSLQPRDNVRAPSAPAFPGLPAQTPRPRSPAGGPGDGRARHPVSAGNCSTNDCTPPQLLAEAGLEGGTAQRRPRPRTDRRRPCPIRPLPVIRDGSDDRLPTPTSAAPAGVIEDASLILHHDHRPLRSGGPCPSSPARRGGSAQRRRGAAALARRRWPKKRRKNSARPASNWPVAVAAALGNGDWENALSLRQSPGARPLARSRVAPQGAESAVAHEPLVDLTLDIAAIKSRIRKSYKALITSGSSGRLTLLADSDAAAGRTALHLQVAGRATRSEESWQGAAQRHRRRRCLPRPPARRCGRSVGGGFFHVTRDEGLYAVAAYDRSLFDKPLGHVVQFRAIEELKRRGARWYRIGAALCRRPAGTERRKGWRRRSRKVSPPTCCRCSG